eukprot:COSAG06_NODE_38051_length_428_cov_0.607903_1_plen_62_part_01
MAIVAVWRAVVPQVARVGAEREGVGEGKKGSAGDSAGVCGSNEDFRYTVFLLCLSRACLVKS